MFILSSMLPSLSIYPSVFLWCIYAAAAVANMLKGGEKACLKSTQYHTHYTLKQKKKALVLLPENIQ